MRGETEAEGGARETERGSFYIQKRLDIKKLKGKTHDVYRLRIGEHRFVYFVDDEIVWVQNAFRRERGYDKSR